MSLPEFAFIPVEIIRDRRLTLIQVRVLVALYSFRNKNTDLVWPSREALAEQTGYTVHRISNATKELVELGWLTKEGSGGRTKRNKYKIHVPDLAETVPEPGTVPEVETVPELSTQTVPEPGIKTVPEPGTPIKSTNKFNYKGTKVAQAPRKKPPDKKSITTETWKAFAEAYQKRYDVEPIRNAKVNSQLKQFVSHVGQEEAPIIAAYFVLSDNPYYLRKGHDVGSLLADWQVLRTECVTGKPRDTGNEANRGLSNVQRVDAAIEKRRRERERREFAGRTYDGTYHRGTH